MKKDALDLCSQEPIHIPGYIQAHGLLIIIDQKGDILYCSENVLQLTGLVPSGVLGKPVTLLNGFFGKPENQRFIEDLIRLSWQGREFKPLNPYVVEIERQPYNMILSMSGVNYILDFEPEASDLFTDPQNTVGASLSQMLADRDLQTILDNAAVQIRNIIHYDRIMIYKFHGDGHGEVVAEDREDHLETWLGLHYPAADIPQQARELYMRNFTRLIANVADTPVAILGSTGAPADLTNSSVRAVSPIHIRYLKNMGVNSSFSVSIIVDNQLWGLIACHNYSPRFINFKQRETAKLIGQVLSSCIGLRNQEKLQQDSISLQTVVMEITRSLLNSDRTAAFISDCAETILSSYRATGVSFLFEGEIYSFGEVPDHEQILEIAMEIGKNEQGFISSDNCAQSFPSLSVCSSRFAGILGCRLTQDLKDCLILFRPELSLTVRWAGDPSKIVNFDENGQPFISPRNSFEQWTQEVKNSSEKWSSTEIKTLLEIRDEINFAIGRKTTELRILNEKLRDAYAELDSFAHTVSHDLKTPLTAIKAFAELIQRKTAENDVRMMSARIVDNSERLYRMIQTVLEYSKVGQQYINKEKVEMGSLLHEIREQLMVGKINDNLQVNIQSAPDVEGDPILIFQVFLNIIENAVKYSHKVASPVVSVEGFVENNEVVYKIKDNGIGINAEQQSKIFGLFNRVGKSEEFEGNGVGLATVKKIMTRHGASIHVESTEGEGSTFILKFPTGEVA